MKTLKAFFIAITFVFLASGCKQITKVTDVITQPSPREIYARDFKEDTVRFNRWQRAFDVAKRDSVSIKVPYVESGRFNDRYLDTRGYTLHLEQGEIFHVEIGFKVSGIPIFLDLLQVGADTLREPKVIAQNELYTTRFDHTVKKTGDYKLIVQPGIGAQGAYNLKVYRTPLFRFPVAGKGNAAIQSFWGARRDGGRRSHEGLDIFADRGTPVIAATDGWISSTGNRGLGGKQVWLRAGLFGNSLYYAHLDSIATQSGKHVKTGDTLGFVGNTGNARTTPTHLHFGIYQGRGGAINPLPYVFEGTAPLVNDRDTEIPVRGVVKAARANLRASAFAKAIKLGTINRNDTLSILGQSQNWLHIRTKERKAAFIYESLIETIGQ